MARLLMRPTEAITMTADAPTLLQPKVGRPYANLTGSLSTLDAESATFSVPRSERNPRPAVRNYSQHTHTSVIVSTFVKPLIPSAPELSMGWVDPWVGLDRVGSRFFSFFVGWVGSTTAKVLKS